MPVRSTELSCGYDFFAPEELNLGPEWTEVNTHVRLTDEDEVILYENIPEDVREGLAYLPRMVGLFIFPKSGLAREYKFHFPNIVPIIDLDYRDEIILYIRTDVACRIEKGQKFVQGVFLPTGILRNEIPPTAKRNGGFGSTGAF